MYNRDNKIKKDNEEKIIVTAFYRVNHSDELLTFLLQKINSSRNNVKNILANRQVLVNGSVVTQFNFMLAKDDEVKITKKPVIKKSENKSNLQKKKQYKISVLYEDDDFIAIDKPYGLLAVESDTERECAFAYVFAYLQSKNKAFRPYVLHRIDKDTSGVLVFAKNIKVHSMLKLKWNEYVKKREYYAIVEGHMTEKKKTIISYLMENQNNLVYSTKDPSGQKSITHYEVQKENTNYSLLKVLIDTGRKNQIRVHMQDLNHPIIGDDKYGCTKNPIKRLGLHASSLAFTHPITNELIEINSTVPKVFYSLFD